jgi:hypothetical protein
MALPRAPVPPGVFVTRENEMSDLDKMDKLIRKEKRLENKRGMGLDDEEFHKVYAKWLQVEQAICEFESSDPFVIRYVEYYRNPRAIRKEVKECEYRSHE